jgi:dTDP-glucose pyrophosphorylase
MREFRNHIIYKDITIRKVLERLDRLASDAVLFLIDEKEHLIGSITDGDIRRSLIKGGSINDNVEQFTNKNPRFIVKSEYSIHDINAIRDQKISVIPVVDNEKKIVNILNFDKLKSYLPLDAVIMAGGKGKRLGSLTENIPKPLLNVGDKPIIEHNINRLMEFGIDDFWISVHHLGEKIEDYLKKFNEEEIEINYIYEHKPLGTIGAIKKIKTLKHKYLLISNSDILTNLDYEDFFIDFLDKEADLSVLSVPFKVDIPYAVLETSDGIIHNFKEKPSYTYYSSGGIYIMKKEIIEHIPENDFYNATDLIEFLIKNGNKVITYPLRGYWLDIGNPEDYQKANQDFKHIKF